MGVLFEIGTYNMNPGRIAFLFAGVLTLMEGNCASSQSVERVQVSSIAPTFDPALVAECKDQLNLIWEACQAHRRMNSEYPKTLTSLVGRFLKDEVILICPIARSAESYGLGMNLRSPHGVDPETAYGYEFTSNSLPPKLTDGIEMTERQYKELLLKSPVERRIPLVRCMRHRPVLNLSVNGTFFRSGAYWEPEFVDLIAQSYLMPAMIRRDQRPIQERIPMRSTKDPRLIDLSGVYNALFDDPWWVGHSNFGLARLSDRLLGGVGTFGGIEFDVRGVVQLGSKPWTSPGFSLSEYKLKLQRVSDINQLDSDEVSSVVVAMVGPNLHVRIVNEYGEVVADRKEVHATRNRNAKVLKELFESFSLRKLSRKEEGEIITRAASLALPRHLKGFSSPYFPPKSEAIPIDRECTQLQVLHGTLFEAPEGAKIAEIVVMRNGAPPLVLPINYSEHVVNLWRSPKEIEDERFPIPVWAGTNPECLEGALGRACPKCSLRT